MEEITSIKDLTATQLLKHINDCQNLHEKTKTEMVDILFEIEALEHSINEKSQILTYLEKQYVELIEELNNRKPEELHNGIR